MANSDRPAEETNTPFVMPDDRQPEPIADAEIVEDRVGTPPEAELAAEAVEDAAPARDSTPPRDPDPAPRQSRPEMVAPPAPAPRRSGAFLGFVTGGILAAGGGFALARYYPDVLPMGDSAAVSVQVAAQTAELAALRTRLDELDPLQAQVAELAARPLPEPAPDLDALRADLEGRIAAIAPPADPAPAIAEARAALDAGLQALDGRIAVLEQRPAGVAVAGVAGAAPSGAVDDAVLLSLRAEIAATAAEVDTLRAEITASAGEGATAAAELQTLAAEAQTRIEAAGAEAERLRAEAETTARAALAQAALNRMQAALEAGGPFMSAIDDLAAAGATVPQALVDAAPEGLPTLTDLQRDFPAPAREALGAALRSDPGEGWADRVTAFLRSQTGARSLEPREGPDPDAVLSRAEAALGVGDVATALTELAALPDPAKAPLAGWIAEAQRREAASAALADLSAAIDAE